MNSFGLIRVAAAMPRVHMAQPAKNVAEMLNLALKLAGKQVSVVVFPELSLTGASCGDLFSQSRLLADAEQAVASLAEQTARLDAMFVAGAPVRHAGRIFDCAVVLRRGCILGLVPRSFPDGRFSPARMLPADGIRIRYAGQEEVLLGTGQLFRIGEALAAVEIGDDLMAPVPPCTRAALAGAQLLLVPAASDEYVGRHAFRKNQLSATASRLHAACVYCSCAEGESTQDLVWAGASLIYERHTLLAESELFARGSRYIAADLDMERLETLRSKDLPAGADASPSPFVIHNTGKAAPTDFEAGLLRRVDPHPFIPPEAELDGRCAGILAAQVAGLATRLEHIRCRKAVLGISGGLDSTLALLVSALTFDTLGLPRKDIIGVTMPGFGTTDRTHDNSLALMRGLGITDREISIVPAVRQHFADIGQDEGTHDLTYENSQARERTQILMDLAGKEGGLVVGTGDLSELALGWCTFNGDHMSMYDVNAGVPKTLLRTIVRWAARHRFGDSGDLCRTLLDIADTPISPELLPADAEGKIAQKTEDKVGPYELHDFFLYHFMRSGASPDKILFLARKAFAGIYDDTALRKWLETFLRRFFQQQFKRSCLPDGPKVGSVSLSPRGGWEMPSDLDDYWTLTE